MTDVSTEGQTTDIPSCYWEAHLECAKLNCTSAAKRYYIIANLVRVKVTFHSVNLGTYHRMPHLHGFRVVQEN